MDQPPEGWTVRCRVERVVDGDTVDVTITKKIRVRLEDVWAPEMDTEAGREVTAWLRDWIEGKEVTLFIPGEQDIRHILTFGRFVGRLWIDGVDVNERIQEHLQRADAEDRMEEQAG